MKSYCLFKYGFFVFRFGGGELFLLFPGSWDFLKLEDPGVRFQGMPRAVFQSVSVGMFLPLRRRVDAAVSQREDDQVVRHAGNGAQDSFRPSGGSVKDAEGRGGVPAAQFAEGSGGYLGGGRPAHARDRVRAFLHPGVTLPAAVSDAVVRKELQLQHVLFQKKISIGRRG